MTQDRLEIVRRCCSEGPSALADVAADGFAREDDTATGAFLLRRTLFPALVVNVDEVFEATGDRVVARLTLRTEPRADAPSWPAVHMFRFDGLRVASVWSIQDPLPWLQALGIVPSDADIQSALERAARSQSAS